jgi:hypothetical protein
MSTFRRIIPFLFLFALLIVNVAAQEETAIPEPTSAPVETLIPTLEPEPTAVPTPSPVDSDTYEETIDGLISLIETLVATQVDLSKITGIALTVLTIAVVGGWVFSKFTTTTKDDEFFERLFNLLRRPEIGITNVSNQAAPRPKSDG